MKFIKIYLTVVFPLAIMASCGSKVAEDKIYLQDSAKIQLATPLQTDTLYKNTLEDTSSSNVNTSEIIAYAKSLIGVPYQYGSSDKNIGFDCSGFITAVYRNFNITVPRSSVEFTNFGTTIPIQQCKPGDFILFTGTDSTKRIVGHMGIIIQTQDTIKFIHSTSGKAYGVTITPLNSYYQGRFEKIIRIDQLEQN